MDKRYVFTKTGFCLYNNQTSSSSDSEEEDVSIDKRKYRGWFRDYALFREYVNTESFTMRSVRAIWGRAENPKPSSEVHALDVRGVGSFSYMKRDCLKFFEWMKKHRLVRKARAKQEKISKDNKKRKMSRMERKERCLRSVIEDPAEIPFDASTNHKIHQYCK